VHCQMTEVELALQVVESPIGPQTVALVAGVGADGGVAEVGGSQRGVLDLAYIAAAAAHDESAVPVVGEDQRKVDLLADHAVDLAVRNFDLSSGLGAVDCHSFGDKYIRKQQVGDSRAGSLRGRGGREQAEQEGERYAAGSFPTDELGMPRHVGHLNAARLSQRDYSIEGGLGKRFSAKFQVSERVYLVIAVIWKIFEANFHHVFLAGALCDPSFDSVYTVELSCPNLSHQTMPDRVLIRRSRDFFLDNPLTNENAVWIVSYPGLLCKKKDTLQRVGLDYYLTCRTQGTPAIYRAGPK